MSLRKLLKWHFFSVQTIEHAGRDQAGAVNRRDGWITTHENLNGHLQAQMSSTSKGRDDVIFDYGKPELEISHVLWHNNVALELSSQHRIIFNTNPERQIDFTTTLTKDNVFIMDVVSPREPVIKRRASSKTLFEIFLKKADRWTL